MLRKKHFTETVNTKETNTYNIALRIKIEYAEKLQTIADDKNLRISALARQIIENWIDEYTKNNE